MHASEDRCFAIPRCMVQTQKMHRGPAPRKSEIKTVMNGHLKLCQKELKDKVKHSWVSGNAGGSESGVPTANSVVWSSDAFGIVQAMLVRQSSWCDVAHCLGLTNDNHKYCQESMDDTSYLFKLNAGDS